MKLSSLGWDSFFANHFQPFSADGLVPARVVREHKHAYELFSEAGALDAICTGRLLDSAAARNDLPAIGDWVVARLRPGELRADIHAMLPRRTKFSRRAPDGTDEQIVAANIDVLLLVTALDQNYNLRRIERYLAVAWESGAQPVVVLNKADLHFAPDLAKAKVESIALGAPVVILSAIDANVVAALSPWVAPGRTVALLGSSGVGKSTLINRLLEAETQATAATSVSHGKGRHTTTHRELFVAPSGALVIDTPGMRELQLWEVGAPALDTTFADIAALASRCRFHDCAHQSEPGCAVRRALETGALAEERWASFQKLRREQAYAARKVDKRLAAASRSDWRKINRELRAHYRLKGGE